MSCMDLDRKYCFFLQLCFFFSCSISNGENVGVETVGSINYPNDGMVNAARIELPQDHYVTCGFTNRTGTLGWFGMRTTPGRIVKVDLSDPNNIRKIQTIVLPEGENLIRAAVIDGAEEYGYFGTETDPAKIIKVDLETMTRVDAITLPPGEVDLYAATTDPTGTTAYFGTRTEPGVIVRVDLTTFQRTGGLPLPAIESNLLSAVVDASGEFAYFGCDVNPGRVVKIRLQNFTRVGSLALAGTLEPRQGIIDPTGLFAYFCGNNSPGQVIRIDLTDFTQYEVLNLPAGVDYPTSMLINASGTRALLGLELGRIAQVNLVNFSYEAVYFEVGPYTFPLLTAVRPRDLPETGFFVSNNAPSSLFSANISSALLGQPRYLEYENSLSGAVVDHDGRYAYYTTRLPVPRIVKVDLEKRERVDSIVFYPYSDSAGPITSSAIDREDKYAYFGMESAGEFIPVARFGKVDLDTFSPYGFIASSSKSAYSPIVFDEIGNRAWVGSRTYGPNSHIQVSSFDATGFDLGGDEFNVNAAENGDLTAGVYDPVSGYPIFGSDHSPASLYRFDADLSGLTIVPLPAGFDSCNLLVRHPTNGLLYAGLGITKGKLLAFDFSVFGISSSKDVTLDGGIYSGAFLPGGDSGIFTTNGSILKVDSTLSTVEGKLKLPIGDARAVGLVLSSEGDRAWYGSDSDQEGRIRQVNLFPRDQVKATKVQVPTAADVTSMSFYTHAAVGPRRFFVERFARGQDAPASIAFDRAGGLALFGTATLPGQVVKFDTEAMMVAANTTLKSGSDDLECAIMEPDGLHACFGTFTSPGRVIRFRTSDLGVEGSIDLSPGEDNLIAAGVAPSGEHGYFASSTSPAQVIKVQLAPLARVDGLILEAGEEQPKCLLVDPTGEFAYVGCGTFISRVVKIRLSDFTRVGALPFESGENFLRCGAIDPTGTFAYFGTDTLPAQIVKVRLSDFTRVDALTLGPDEYAAFAMDIDPAGDRLVVGLASFPARVAVIDLVTFSRTGAARLRELESALTPSLVIDSNGENAYLGIGTSPGRVVRVELAPKPLRLGIFGNSDESRNLLWQSSPVPLSASEEWVNVPISQGSPPNLILPPDDYWLAWQVDASTDAASYIPGASGEGFSLYWPAGPFPSSVTAETSTGMIDTAETWSVYITYDEAPTATPTRSRTATRTATPTATPTSTPSFTPGVTPTLTPTPTPSRTPSTTPSAINYDIEPDPPDGVVDQLDLLEWLRRIREEGDPGRLLLDFAGFWREPVTP